VPAIRKQKSKLHCTLTATDQATAHGGQLLVDALCRRFDLWQRLDALPGLDPRRRQSTGFAPSALVAQLLFTLTSGGCSLADAERLGQDRVLLDLVGLAQAADQTTLGEFLRAQSRERVQGLMELNAQFVDWAWAKTRPARLQHAGWTEYFFDDTEIEVYGPKIAGARVNYEGNRALSWQVLWQGPFQRRPVRQRHRPGRVHPLEHFLQQVDQQTGGVGGRTAGHGLVGADGGRTRCPGRSVCVGAAPARGMRAGSRLRGGATPSARGDVLPVRVCPV
jgi:hypothetical protein